MNGDVHEVDAPVRDRGDTMLMTTILVSFLMVGVRVDLCE